MKLIIRYFFPFAFFPLHGFSQNMTLNPHADSVKNMFVQLYNQGNSTAIYNMCDTGFRRYLKSYGFAQWFSETR